MSNGWLTEVATLQRNGDMTVAYSHEIKKTTLTLPLEFPSLLVRIVCSSLQKVALNPKFSVLVRLRDKGNTYYDRRWHRWNTGQCQNRLDLEFRLQHLPSVLGKSRYYWYRVRCLKISKLFFCFESSFKYLLQGYMYKVCYVYCI